MNESTIRPARRPVHLGLQKLEIVAQASPAHADGKRRNAAVARKPHVPLVHVGSAVDARRRTSGPSSREARTARSRAAGTPRTTRRSGLAPRVSSPTSCPRPRGASGASPRVLVHAAETDNDANDRGTCPAARAAGRPGRSSRSSHLRLFWYKRVIVVESSALSSAPTWSAGRPCVVRRRLPAATRFAVCFVIGLAVRIGGLIRATPRPDVSEARTPCPASARRRRRRAQCARPGRRPPPRPSATRRRKTCLRRLEDRLHVEPAAAAAAAAARSEALQVLREREHGVLDDARSAGGDVAGRHHLAARVPVLRGKRRTRQDRRSAFYFFESKKKRLRRADRGGAIGRGRDEGSARAVRRRARGRRRAEGVNARAKKRVVVRDTRPRLARVGLEREHQTRSFVVPAVPRSRRSRSRRRGSARARLLANAPRTSARRICSSRRRRAGPA